MNTHDTSFFHKNGYQIFEDVLPIELVEQSKILVEQSAKESLASACAELGCRGGAEVVEKIDEISRGIGRTVDMLSKETRDTLSGHISLKARLSAGIRNLPTHESVQNVVKSLVKSQKIFMHMPPTPRFVLAGNIHAGVPPHQDVAYNRHLTDFVVVWIPLVDIDEDCGGVVVYQGSGFAPEQPVTEQPQHFWQAAVPTAGFPPLHCKLKRGDILALNKWVIHGSMANKSNRTRYSIDCRFFGEQDASTKHFLDLQKNIVIAPKEVSQ